MTPIADHATPSGCATGSPSSTARRQLDERDPSLPRQLRHQVRRAVPPLDRDPRPARARRPGRAAAAAAPAARPASSPASTRAATSSAACTRRRPTRSSAGLTRFEVNINKARQDVLNPEGINALRFFEGRGNRVWGARTHELRPGVEVRQRAAPVHLHRALDRQGHPVGGVRAEQRAALGEHPPHRRGLPARAVERRRPARVESRSRPTSSAATARR